MKLKELKPAKSWKKEFGSFGTMYEGFNEKEPYTTDIIISKRAKEQVNENYDKVIERIEEYITKRNLTKIELFYNGEYDYIGITYNI